MSLAPGLPFPGCREGQSSSLFVQCTPHTIPHQRGHLCPPAAFFREGTTGGLSIHRQVVCNRLACGHPESPCPENPKASDLVPHLWVPDGFPFLERVALRAKPHGPVTGRAGAALPRRACFPRAVLSRWGSQPGTHRVQLIGGF